LPPKSKSKTSLQSEEKKLHSKKHDNLEGIQIRKLRGSCGFLKNIGSGSIGHMDRYLLLPEKLCNKKWNWTLAGVLDLNQRVDDNSPETG
jgi:hypothetical protein